jgi:riboflavin synthase
LVQQVARVSAVEPLDTGTRYTFALSAPLRRGGVRHVIAVNGVCLTIQDLTETSLTVTVWAATARKTNLSGLALGELANLELAEAGEIIEDGEAGR